MGRVRDFLKTLHRFEEVLTHISQESGQTISLDSLKLVISQHYPELHDHQVENVIDSLLSTQPFAILEPVEDEVTFTLTEKVSNLLLWLSNRMYLVHDKYIKTIVTELRETTAKVSAEMESNQINIHVIDSHLESMWRMMKQLRNISEGNKRAIGTQTQELRDQEIDYEVKVVRAQIIQDHLEPMRELIKEDSGIVTAVKEADLVLSKIRSTFTIRDNVKEKAGRLSTELGRTSLAMRTDHMSAFSTIQPFLDIYLKSQGDLVRGSNRAISIMNEKGPKSLDIENKISILIPKRPKNIITDVNMYSWFRRVSAAAFSPVDRRIRASGVAQAVMAIPIKSTTQSLRIGDHIPDALTELLNMYPSHSLSECNKALIDIIVTINDYSGVQFGERKRYRRGEYELEVSCIELR